MNQLNPKDDRARRNIFNRKSSDYGRKKPQCANHRAAKDGRHTLTTLNSTESHEKPTIAASVRLQE